MDLKLDVHTHTVASGHAYSTIEEMARAASDRGLELLGITEHGPLIPGTCNPLYFMNMHVIPRRMYGIELMLGAEVDIVDYEGGIDLGMPHLGRLDITIAGIHRQCYTPGTVEQNTSAVVGAMRNPQVDIISHPADGAADVDFESIVKASLESGTLLEINNHSLAPVRKLTAARDNNIALLRLCRRYDLPVILGSDAHISFDIGRHDRLDELLELVGFPDELIINRSVEMFKSLIKKRSIR